MDGIKYARRRGVISPGGDMKAPKMETVEQAEAECASREECIGFAFHSTCSSDLNCQTVVTLKRQFSFQPTHQRRDVVYIKKIPRASTDDGNQFRVIGSGGGVNAGSATSELWWAWLLLAIALAAIGLLIAGFFVRKMRKRKLDRSVEVEKPEESRSCTTKGWCVTPRGAEEKPLIPKDLPWWDEIRRELEGRYEAETIEEFKKQFFGGIEHWMGREILEDVDTALLVRVNHTTWCGCFILSLLTLGLYACFRPRQDLAILVITKKGRVILLKRLPHSMLGFEPGHGIFVIVLYLALLVTVTLAPVAAGYFLTEYLDMDYNGLLDLLHPSLASNIKASLGHQWKVYYGIVFLFWGAFLVWVWTHRQRGYGRRFLREFKASSVAAAQYVLQDEGCLANCCIGRGRYGQLRLYFGKYPAREELDENLPLGCPSCHAAVPLDSIGMQEDASLSSNGPPSAEDSQVADRGGLERKVSRYFPFLSFLLLATTAVAEGLKFYGYYEQYHKMKKANGFCKQASNEGACDEDHCRQWAADVNIDNLAFCSHVSWIKTAGTEEHVLSSLGLNTDALAEHTKSEKALCSILHVGKHECCSGCIHGHLFEWLGGDDIEKWWDNLSDAMSYVLLFLALFMSKMAMAYKFSQKKETNCLDIEFVQNFNQPEDDYFQVKDELALRILQKVFNEADIHKDTSKNTKRVGRSSQGADVEIHDDLEDIHNWHDFFRHHRLVKYGKGFLGQQEPTDFFVPRTCLGMSAKEEKIIEVWTEQPFLSYNESIYILIGAFVLMSLLSFWPQEYGGPLIFGRCSSSDFTDRKLFFCKVVRWCEVVISTIVLWVVLVTLRYMFAYARQQSIVVVTNERIFAIYHRPHWLALICPKGCELPFVLRVEAFRHGDTTFYGRMSSRMPPWHVRLCGLSRWAAGEVVFKCHYGVLELARHYGEVGPVYELTSTILVKQVENYDFEGQARRGHLRMQVPVWYGIKEEPEDEADAPKPSYFSSFFTSRGKNQPFTFETIPDDPYGRKKVTWFAEIEGPDADAEHISSRHFMMAPGKEERLVYVWSFQEAGLLADPYNRYNDVVVTTDRIRFHSKSEYKTFDCRTCLCWGFCWCACLKRWCGGDFKPQVQAFLNFSHLEAFSTETSMMPAVCLCRCPCYDAFCGLLTGLICCDFGGASASAGQCFQLPGTNEPQAQLWLRWLQRYARSSQPDMVLSQRPARLEPPRPEGDEEVSEQGKTVEPYEAQDPELGGCNACWPLPVMSKDVPEVRDLRELMRFVMEKEESKLNKAEARWLG